jgi:PAS domain S-box-containing protein
MRIENQTELASSSLGSLFANSPIGVFIVQDGKFRFVNAEFQKISGYTEDELIGMESSGLILEEDVESVRDNAAGMLKGDRINPYLYRVVDKEGERKWIIESVTSIKYRGNRATLGYFMDNTEHERAKEAMRLSEDKFHKAFRSSPEWIVISTLEDGFYIDVNETFIKTTGYSREEVIGCTSIELGIWVDPAQRTGMVEVLREKGKVRDLEAVFRMKSGEIRTMLWSAEIIIYGEETCLLAVTRDITHRKQAEREKLFRGKLQGVLEMAGATCHEMNQPLQIAFVLIDKLKEENPRSNTVKDFERQLVRMKAITDKVNSITSYETKDYIRGHKIIDIERASGND